MVNKGTFAGALLVLTAFSGCALAVAEVGNVSVTKSGTDTPGAFCADFSLTNAQALEFFRKSREVSAREVHDKYEYLPCYVEGSLIRSGQQCKFSIRAGGTAELKCGEGSFQFFVCDKCDHLLGGTR